MAKMTANTDDDSPDEGKVPPGKPESGSTADSDTDADQDPFTALLAFDPAIVSDADINKAVNAHMDTVVKKHKIAEDYSVLFLYDSVAIGRTDADRIYRAISEDNSGKPVLLIVTSPGGDVASAYLIAKLCREHSTGRFEVVVPRQAKSAATLIACGADHIHMGSLSELGPIDPQFGHIPALALKNSVEHLATLVQEYPQASEMFASYLARSLRVEALGYYERVAESAVQYAIRLLDRRLVYGAHPSDRIANTLVYEYKDHGFVIDAGEATGIFGNEVVLTNTPAYHLGNAVYNALKFLEWFIEWRYSRRFAFTGNTAMGCLVAEQQHES